MPVTTRGRRLSSPPSPPNELVPAGPPPALPTRIMGEGTLAFSLLCSAVALLGNDRLRAIGEPGEEAGPALKAHLIAGLGARTHATQILVAAAVDQALKNNRLPRTIPPRGKQ